MFDPYHKWLGIPPEDQPPTHYRLLGLNPFESDPDVIANAADQRMAHVKQYQAGRHSAESQEILNEIAAANLCLLHPARKAAYDSRLRELAAPLTAPPVWSATETAPRGRRFEWRALWESERFWQTASAVAAVLLLILGAIAFLRAREVVIAEASALRAQRAATPRSVASARPDVAGLSVANRAASRPWPSVAFTSSVSAMVPAREIDRDREPAQPHGDRFAFAPEDLFEGRLRSQRADLSPLGNEPRSPSPARSEESLPRIALRNTANLAVHRPGAARSAPPTMRQVPAASTAAQDSPKSVYLDDLEELIAYTGVGELGKHGATGYPAEQDDYGSRAVFRGTVPGHLLSMHPPEEGTSYASYALAADYRMFYATVGILEVAKTRSGVPAVSPLHLGESLSPLTFRVVGDGNVLWESRPIRRSGDWQECSVSLQGVRLLELQVDCPGLKTFAWAAWVDPRVER